MNLSFYSHFGSYISSNISTTLMASIYLSISPRKLIPIETRFSFWPVVARFLKREGIYIFWERCFCWPWHQRDVIHRINNARPAFTALSKIWKCKYLSTNIKLRLFHVNVFSALRGSNTWKVTAIDTQKLQAFISTCLRVSWEYYSILNYVSTRARLQ